MTNRQLRLPAMTTQRIIAALALLIFGYFFLAGISLFAFFTLYLLFVVITILVVRSVPVQPGQWLGRRAVRRGLVAVIALGCLLNLTDAGAGNSQAGILILLVLVLGFIALGRATQRVASAPDTQVDERQEALRNAAHRIAYLFLTFLTGAIVLITYMVGGSARAWLSDPTRGGPVTTFFLLLLFLPAMVLAWLEPDRLASDEAPKPANTGRSQLALAMIVIALLTPIASSLTLFLGTPRTTSSVVPQTTQDAGLKCSYFEATTQVGVGFSATIPLRAVACWDGQRASESWGLNASDCRLYRSEETVVETVECTRTIDSQGTLHFVYHARVRSAILTFLTRDAVMTLVLRRDGQVVRFP